MKEHLFAALKTVVMLALAPMVGAGG